MPTDTLYLFFGTIFIILIIVLLIVLKRLSNSKIDFERLIKRFDEKEKLLAESENIMRQQQLTFENERLKIKIDADQNAKESFTNEIHRFKTIEIEQIEKNKTDEAKIQLENWKIQHTAMIRKSAANKSYSVVLGKVTEHLLPFHPNFPFNPQDARFIGGPIDLIVFDGLTDGDKEVTIFFVEIKTGKSRFNDRQIKVMEAIKNQRIEWYPIRETDLNL